MIEKFDFAVHGERLERWLKKRGVSLPDKRLLSNLGFVSNGIAIGFLFCTQAGQAYIDHVAADPDSNSHLRDQALDELFNALEVEAKKMGYVMAMALAALPAMKRRFMSRGYYPHGDYTLFYKVLGGK